MKSLLNIYFMLFLGIVANAQTPKTKFLQNKQYYISTLQI